MQFFEPICNRNAALQFLKRASHSLRTAPYLAVSVDDLKEKLGKMVETVMEAIDVRIDGFFVQALQLDIFTLKMEFKS